MASLASRQIFSLPILLWNRRPRFPNFLHSSLSVLSDTILYDDDDNQSPHNNVRISLIEECRTVNQRGWLRDSFSKRLSGIYSDLEFNELCAMNGLFDYIIYIVLQHPLEQPVLSTLLCYALKPKPIRTFNLRKPGWTSFQNRL